MCLNSIATFCESEDRPTELDEPDCEEESDEEGWLGSAGVAGCCLDLDELVAEPLRDGPEPE
jgi:hypothetical protein